MLRLAHRLLSNYPDIMLLADRGFANHDLMSWLQEITWHYCLRVPCDVKLHGPRRHPLEIMYLWPRNRSSSLSQCPLVVGWRMSL